MFLGLALVFLHIGYSAAGPRCYECRDISSPLECGFVTTCSDIQECYVDQVVSSGGLILYNSGCRSKQRCSGSGKRSHFPYKSKKQTTDVVTCSECCQGEFCNEKGCGITVPIPRLSGPNCFKCTDMQHPSECRQVVTCELGQLCMLYEVNRFGQTLYDSRCESQKVCQVIASLPQPIGRRRQSSFQPLCHSCCTGNFCNDRCNVNITMTTAKTSAIMTVHQSATSPPTSTLRPTTLSLLMSSASPSATSSKPTTRISSTFSSSPPLSPADKCRLYGYAYVPFLPFCFKLHYDRFTWARANSACTNEGGMLAVIDIKAKWDFLKAVLAQDSHYTNKYVWLGARDVNNNNTFYWLTGAQVKFNYWRFQQPDGFSSSTIGNCVSSMGADNFHWHDISCSSQNPFICTKPV